MSLFEEKIFEKSVPSNDMDGSTLLDQGVNIALDQNIKDLLLEFELTYTNTATPPTLTKGLYGLVQRLSLKDPDENDVLELTSPLSIEAYSRFITGTKYTEDLPLTASTQFVKRWMFKIPAFLEKSSKGQGTLDIKLGDFDADIFALANAPTFDSLSVRIHAEYAKKLPIQIEAYDGKKTVEAASQDHELTMRTGKNLRQVILFTEHNAPASYLTNSWENNINEITLKTGSKTHFESTFSLAEWKWMDAINYEYADLVKYVEGTHAYLGYIDTDIQTSVNTKLIPKTNASALTTDIIRSIYHFVKDLSQKDKDD